MRIAHHYRDFTVIVDISDWRYFIGVDIDLKFPNIPHKFHNDRIIIEEKPFSAIKGLW